MLRYVIVLQVTVLATVAASAHALLTEKRKLRLQSCLSWTTLWAGGENGSAHPDHFDEAARRIP